MQEESKCKACGASMEFNKEQSAFICPYCGNSIYIKQEKKDVVIEKKPEPNFHKQYGEPQFIYVKEEPKKQDSNIGVRLMFFFIGIGMLIFFMSML